MKFNKANFDLMAVVGGVAGGVVAKVVEKFTKKEDQENNYLTIGVQAAVGAAISAFVKNNAVKAAGAGMVGVAGYNLANELNIGDSDDDTDTGSPKESGIGALLPAQMAIASAATATKYHSKGIKGTAEKQTQKNNVI